jgi:hypothetical protein
MQASCLFHALLSQIQMPALSPVPYSKATMVVRCQRSSIISGQRYLPRETAFSKPSSIEQGNPTQLIAGPDGKNLCCVLKSYRLGHPECLEGFSLDASTRVNL